MAYVLMNTKIGSHTISLDQIRKIDGVQEAFNLWGIYDIIVRVKADTEEKLTYIINEKLRSIDIHTKLILMITEPRSEKSRMPERKILEPMLA